VCGQQKATDLDYAFSLSLPLSLSLSPLSLSSLSLSPPLSPSPSLSPSLSLSLPLSLSLRPSDYAPPWHKNCRSSDLAFVAVLDHTLLAKLAGNCACPLPACPVEIELVERTGHGKDGRGKRGGVGGAMEG